MTEFKDRRGREWESFVDESYFHMVCVRVKGERKFNSALSFHFVKAEQAKRFIELLKDSS